MTLNDAISQERELLSPVINSANLVIDTSKTNIYELRELLQARLIDRDKDQLSIQVESFGFKHGVPYDADFVFDVRCLPNPYWEMTLRPLNGKDQRVIDFLEAAPTVATMQKDILDFLQRRIPEFIEHNRNYLTVALGCTGGQHRSVYLADRIAAALSEQHENVIITHSELTPKNSS
jgi:UPF0042 nucleotide-binding protein